MHTATNNQIETILIEATYSEYATRVKEIRHDLRANINKMIDVMREKEYDPLKIAYNVVHDVKGILDKTPGFHPRSTRYVTMDKSIADYMPADPLEIMDSEG